MSFDTGPGNTLIDAATREYYSGLRFDKEGGLAACGNINSQLLGILKQHPYFKKPVPKTTGFEVFHMKWVWQAMKDHGVELKAEDLLATLTRLTVDTISDQILQVLPEGEPAQVFVSGGGVHNKTMMKWLGEQLDPLPLRTMEELGVTADAKEALLFATLANELICGDDTRLHLGKISLPG